MSSVFSFLIVLRVIWIPRAALSLCHCIILMVFFLAAGLIFLALQFGHLCRHGHSIAAHAASPLVHLVLAPARPNCKNWLCNSSLARSQWPTHPLLLSFSCVSSCIKVVTARHEIFSFHNYSSAWKMPARIRKDLFCTGKNPALLVVKCLCSNLHVGQQRDKGRKIGSPGNDDAILPIMIDACALHQSFSDLCQQLCKGFSEEPGRIPRCF